MENVFISVIVPVYNIAAVLRPCLDSIAAQTYPHFEALLLDDGSTDGSGEICDQYAERDPRFRVFHQENRGLSAVRNRGISLAQGAYLAFVDGDDTVAQDYLAALSAAAQADSADLVCCNYTVTDEAGQVLATHPRGAEGIAPNVAAARTVCSFDTLMADTFARREYYPTHVNAALFRTEAVKGLTFCETMRFYEDGLFLFQLFCRRPKVTLLPYAGYFYRLRQSSITRAVTPFALQSREDNLALCLQRHTCLRALGSPYAPAALERCGEGIHAVAYAAAQGEKRHLRSCYRRLLPCIETLRPYSHEFSRGTRFRVGLYRRLPRLHQLLSYLNERIKG